MAKVMYIFDEPKTCSECRFIGHTDYIRDHDFNVRLYRRIARCEIAPQSIEDPWMEVDWLFNNKPEWCPLRPVKED